MMRHLLIAVAGLMGLAAPAHAADAPGKVSLRPGEQTIVLIDDGGRVTVAKGGPARMSEYDRAAVFELLRNHPDAVGSIAAIHTEDDGHLPPPPPVERGAVRISFLAVAATGKESESRLLLVENGYDRGLRYRAIISRSARNEPTDVCVVIPERRGYEHWPYPIDRIELSGLTLFSLREGDPLTCE
jgi:hypothetical protein